MPVRAQEFGSDTLLTAFISASRAIAYWYVRRAAKASEGWQTAQIEAHGGAGFLNDNQLSRHDEAASSHELQCFWPVDGYGCS